MYFVLWCSIYIRTLYIMRIIKCGVVTNLGGWDYWSSLCLYLHNNAWYNTCFYYWYFVWKTKMSRIYSHKNDSDRYRPTFFFYRLAAHCTFEKYVQALCNWSPGHLICIHGVCVPVEMCLYLFHTFELERKKKKTKQWQSIGINAINMSHTYDEIHLSGEEVKCTL